MRSLIEEVRIFHHGLHKKYIRQSSILKLDTGSEILEGHENCARFLENQVANLLFLKHVANSSSMEVLLTETERVFTRDDNSAFLACPTEK